MDPYSAEGELVNIHSAYHQGQYSSVLSFDTSSLSPSNNLPARVLKLRAQLALGQYSDVLSSLKGPDASTPDLLAVKCLATYLQTPSASSSAVSDAQKLASSDKDNLTVQLLCGTVLANAGLTEEALALLSRHQGSLDAIALTTQIHLSQNRLDLAQKEASAARKWAQDSLLVNMAESWVGMREGGEKYQAAYYVFEELAQAAATQSVKTLVSQAVSELHLGRLPEAEVALQQALEMDAEDGEALANAVVLNRILGKGKEVEEYKGRLETVTKGEHVMLKHFAEKKSLFDTACQKYSPKFEP
ncbi:hypothetical protein LTS18_010603 [Coniosporium uncinatum]|uniref:Uncharacterized protein n=1 Tax=Coniosporium uncinatum TaxID=93489 RepID=A0ACC3CZR2_9PEZI|nr:hypothetical protein LTS18_010603 [Coniosporium uncinatum]